MEQSDDEGAPPNVYRDDATSVSSDGTITIGEDAVLIDGADASDDENYPYREPSPVLKYIPTRVQRTSRAISRWIKGPQPSRPWKIHPYFPTVQYAPIQFVHNYFPKRKHKVFLLIFFYMCWLFCFGLVLWKSAFASDIPGHGSPVRITCTDRFWDNGNGCGLNGNLCRPFENSTMAFRCPANCKQVQLLNPHAVGDQEVSYRPLVIGGPTNAKKGLQSAYYRGDSFICGAAIHAGFLSDQNGGCGVVSLVGKQSKFPSVKQNHITSIGFDSYFPKSFSFLSGTASKCRDLRWPLLGVSVTFTVLLSLFTTSPAVFFPSVYTGIFFHVALASDPPNLTDYYSTVSIALGRFLPASFCMFVVYKYCVRRQQLGLHAQIEKTILWLGGCWVGALNNYTFGKIPIERLTPHDIQNQPGAIPALIIVVLSLFFIALGQAWAIRVEGRLPRYLAVYGVFVACILAMIAVPKMNVRIHHYILALLLVPGTAMQNRPSLLFQGILIGLFIHGIARWGFDSILQTPDELRGDAPLGSLLPMILPPIIYNNPISTGLLPNITFEWTIPLPDVYDGLSVLVNDVERFRGYDDRGKNSFTWVRHDRELPEYFRFGFLSGGRTADYTKAGKWAVNGGWTEMEPGPGLMINP